MRVARSAGYDAAKIRITAQIAYGIALAIAESVRFMPSPFMESVKMHYNSSTGIIDIVMAISTIRTDLKPYIKPHTQPREKRLARQTTKSAIRHPPVSASIIAN